MMLNKQEIISFLSEEKKQDELFKKADVNVVHIPFDQRKIDFLKDEKLNLAFEMLEEMRSLGATPEQLAPLQKRVNELFGSFVQA